MKSLSVTFIIVGLKVIALLCTGERATAALTLDAAVTQFRSVRTADKDNLKSFIPPAQVPSSFDDLAGQVLEVSGRIVGTAL